MPDLQSLQDCLHYSFENANLLEEAFIAAGAAASRHDVDGSKAGNKRLALVGDAVLRLCVLDEWFPKGGTTGKLFPTHLTTAECLERMAIIWFRRSRRTMSCRR
jgi:ribonuclease-3